MAAPTLLNALAGATDAGGVWSYNVTGGAVGRVVIFQALQDGASVGAVALTSASNMADLAGTSNTMTYIGAFMVGQNPTLAYQHLWIGRQTSTNASTLGGTNSTSEDLYMRAYTFENVSAGTTLATVIEHVNPGETGAMWGTSATAEDAAVTTIGQDRLALNFVAVNDDNAIAQFTGQTGGTWIPTDQYAESSGTDGAVMMLWSYPGAIIAPKSLSDFASVFGAGGGGEQYAQSFASGAGGTVTWVRLAVSALGTPTDDLVVEIQTDSGGLPSGTVVGTGGTLAYPLRPTGWYAFEVNATLSASTTYWIVVRRTGSRDISNCWTVNYNTTDPYAGGQLAVRSSGTWATSGYETNDLAFVVNYSNSGSTINGATASITDSDGWGVAGFALIGTTLPGLSLSLLQQLATVVAPALSSQVTATLNQQLATQSAPSIAVATPGMYPTLLAQLASQSAPTVGGADMGPPLNQKLGTQLSPSLVSALGVSLNQRLGTQLAPGLAGALGVALNQKLGTTLSPALSAALGAPLLAQLGALTSPSLWASLGLSLLQVGGAGAADFPVVASRDYGTNDAATNRTDHTIDMPTGIASGDLLIAAYAMDGGRSYDDANNWPTGWTQIFGASNGDTTTAGVSLNIAYRIADGTEGATIAYTTADSSERGVFWSCRIAAGNWHGTTPPVASAAGQSGAGVTGTAADPPSLDPAGWGTEKTLWIAFCGTDEGNAGDITGAPGSYTDLLSVPETTIGGATMGVAYRQYESASDDPSAFTNPNRAWVACVVAVRPAAGGGAAGPQLFAPTVGAADMSPPLLLQLATQLALTVAGADMSPPLSQQLATQLLFEIAVAASNDMYPTLLAQFGSQASPSLSTDLGLSLMQQLGSQMNPALGSDVALPLNTQLGSTSAPSLLAALGLLLNQRLATQSAPSLAAALGLSLLSQLATQQAPKVAGADMGPPLLPQLGTQYGLSLSSQMALALSQQLASQSSPSLVGSLALTLLAQPATQAAPSLVVALGLTLLAQAGTTMAPSLVSYVTMALLPQMATQSAPSLSSDLGLVLAPQLGTQYGPVVGGADMTLTLLAQLGVQFAPTVQEIAAATLYLALLDQLGSQASPSLSSVVEMPLSALLGSQSSPTVGMAGIELSLLSRLATQQSPALSSAMALALLSRLGTQQALSLLAALGVPLSSQLGGQAAPALSSALGLPLAQQSATQYGPALVGALGLTLLDNPAQLLLLTLLGPQVLRPVSDLFTGGWSLTPLWSKVDDDPTSPDGVEIEDTAV